MNTIKLTATSLILTLAGAASFADEHSTDEASHKTITVEVEMLNKRDDGERMVYSEDVTRIKPGDTVKWIPTDRGHNVDFIDGPDNWKAPKRSRIGSEVEYTFDKPGVYTYVCTPHASMGMLATVVVGDVSVENIAAVSDARLRGRGAKARYELILEDIKTSIR